MIIADIRRELYCGDDPFNHVATARADSGYPHTHLLPECVDAVLAVTKPTFWLEVGSMLGGSAIIAAAGIKQMQLPCEIVCVDPFCGCALMWSWEKQLTEEHKWRFVALRDGMPTIHERFMANVAAAGHSDIIIPIPVTSMVGMRLLSRLRAAKRITSLPQVIYLDAAHEAGETYLELNTAWDILAPGGILFGDDWSWPPVRSDVSRFATDVCRPEAAMSALARRLAGASLVGRVVLYRGQWFVVKPSA